MGRERIRVLATPDETLLFGAECATQVALKWSCGGILALQGDLGTGKTTFVQGFLQGLGIQDIAQSPTFTYLQIYEGSSPIYHFDLYRLKTERDFILLGFEELLHAECISIIEWPERIFSLIPKNAMLIDIAHKAPSGRTITIRTWGDR